MNFLKREHIYNNNSNHIIDVYPLYYYYCLFSALFFISLNILLPIFIERKYPIFYKSLNDRKRRELATYSSCLFHHLIVVPIGFISIIKDIYRTSSDLHEFDYIRSEGFIIPYCFGYLVGDTFFLAIQECFNGKPSLFFHHILTFGLVAYASICPSQILRFIPYLLICETSSIFLVIGWFYKCAELFTNRINQICDISFALSFFLFRVVNFPIMLFALSERKELKGTILSYIVLPCILLQLFWFYKIISYIIKPKYKHHIDDDNDKVKKL